MKKTGKTLSSISAITLIAILLSPFDFEGPIAEILPLVAVTTGFILNNKTQGIAKK